MNIYIDESGSFVNAASLGSWNVVSAYVAPEGIRTKLEIVLNTLKQNCREESFKEVKLHQIPEETLLEFLKGLSQLNGLLFCTATDAGLNTSQEVTFHKDGQVQSIRKNIPYMIYPEGKSMVSRLANDVEAMPIQLYVQLTCQVQLIYEVISRSINYYAQRTPGTLSNFRWYIDQKDSEKTVFEYAFERLAPALLESRTIREPMPFVDGFDYRRMAKYEFNDATRPTHLQEQYGLPEMDGFNIGLMLREKMSFVDSKSNLGVQVADILASSIRRCLRGQFERNDLIANYLGGLMVKRSKDNPPVNFITFNIKSSLADKLATRSGLIMKANCRSMILK